MGVDEVLNNSSTPITYYQNSIKSLLLQRYNSKMSSIERVNHQHPLLIIKIYKAFIFYSVYFKDVKYRKGKSSTPNIKHPTPKCPSTPNT